MIVFDDLITDMLSNKKRDPIGTELFRKGRKLNICLVFITQCYLAVLKNVRQNCAYCFIMKFPKKRELQQTAFYHSQILTLDFMNL